MSSGFTLSAREKWLIGLLAFFLAAVFFVVVLFLPARQAHADAAAALDEAKMLELQTRHQIETVVTLEASVADMRRELAKTTAKLEGFTLMEDLVATFTDFMLNNGIKPDAVTLAFDEKENAKRVEHGLIKFTVNMRGTGSLRDLLKMADYTNGVFSYRMMRMSTAKSGNAIGASYVAEVVLRAEEAERQGMLR